jgi:exopolysaccharide/PEP-CTERM locus tyrosine autokinase
MPAATSGRVLERATTGPAAPASPPVPEFVPHSRSGKVLHIDRDQLRSLTMLPPQTQEREVAAQFRAIKRPLVRQLVDTAADTAAKRSIMIASALPGDGKTFTSLNLALSLALEMDFTVLLVDADAPKPHLTHTFGLQSEPGLLDVLADPKLSVEDVILATDVPRLHFLPAGRRSETAAELLASARMREVVAQLESFYGRGVVLFDSPPILLTTESRTLGAIVGQIVLVVRAGVTPQQAVKDAIGVIGEGVRVSLVLNSAELEGPIGYYYGYRYGHEMQPPAPSETATPE